MKEKIKQWVEYFFRWLGFVLKKELEAAQLEVSRRDLLLHHGEVPRAVWSLHENLKTMRGGTKRIKEIIQFCCPALKGNLQVNYPPKGIKADISSNLPVVFIPDTNYPDLASFLKALDMFIPNDKMEVEGKFLNITYPKDLIAYNVGRIALYGD